MKRRTSILTAIILILVFLAPLIATSYDETRLTINSWLGNKPKILVKLDIHIPKNAKGKCYVLVRRFPSMYNPTRDGYTEKVYAGIHKPGDVVEVKKTLNAYISKYNIDEKTGALKIGYYEPQEFFVALLCKDGNTTTFKWNKIVEVYPNKIIYKKDIYPNPNNDNQAIIKTKYKENPNTLTTTTQQIHCTITQTEYQPGDTRLGYCITPVRGPWLYSMWYVKSKFGINSFPKRSAVYFESFSDFDAGPIVKPESQVDWSSAGKKLAVSDATTTTAYLTGPYKDRVYFYVMYKYEWYNNCDSFSSVCYSYWLLYPDSIKGVHRSGAGSVEGIPSEMSSYTPPTYCEYDCVASIDPGASSEVYFSHGSYRPYQSDIPITDIGIMFSLNGVWSAGLYVDFYKAGRDDNQYTTPYVDIVNDRSDVIYLWYDSNDPMTYTIGLCCAQTNPH